MNQKSLLLTTALVTLLAIAGAFWFTKNQASSLLVHEATVVPTEELVAETLSSEPINTSDWKIYRNEKFGFEFQYPSGYKIDEGETEYDREKTYTIAVRDVDEKPLVFITLAGEKPSVPMEGGCWSYFGESLDLTQPLSAVEKKIEEFVPDIELVKIVQIGGRSAVEYNCIGSYATVFATRDVTVPIDTPPYTNMNISPGDPIAFIDIGESPEIKDYKRGIEEIRSKLLQGEYPNDPEVKERQILFDHFIATFSFRAGIW